jgi:hypothetical protein
VLEVLLVIAVCLFALLIRLWHLADLPEVLFHDEADNSITAIQTLVKGHPTIFEYDWKPQPALGTGLQAFSFDLLGINVRALRLPTALLSVLALLPFYLAARIATQSVSASIATTILLSTNVGYLHFSRAAWENIGVCLGVVAAFLLISALLNRQIGRSAKTGSIRAVSHEIALSALIGLWTAFSVMIYFAGRVSVVLIPVYFLIHIVNPETKGTRVSSLVHLGLILFVTALILSPFLVDYEGLIFDQRISSLARLEFPVLRFWNEGRVFDLFRYLFQCSGEAFCWIWWPMDHDERYYPANMSLLPWYSVVFFLVGCYVSLTTRLKNTGWWWVLLVIPYIASQVLISSKFNLARGILILPALYLFVAHGLASCMGICRSRRASILLCMLLATGGAIEGSIRYVTWIQSDEFLMNIEPAIEPEDIEPWLLQMHLIAQGKPNNSCIVPYKKPTDPLRLACEEHRETHHE